MTSLKSKILKTINTVILDQKLEYSIHWFEYFPASKNNPDCNRLIENAAIKNNYPITKRIYPFTFGEDFGWFAKKYKTAMFGLGAGLDSPALHHEDYDFPDEIIDTGANMFIDIITQILNCRK